MWYNKLITMILRSPFHRFLSNDFMVITVTGRKSGKEYTIPVNYLREGDSLWMISLRKRTWWRNLIQGADVKVRLMGRELNGHGQAIVEESAVAESLINFLRYSDNLRKGLEVNVDAEGNPKKEDCARAAQRTILVQVNLDNDA
jgi:deazaflavin-dependent oxidoreductase (nitroreductase family)